jgi:DNA-binding GntR family transcriptional regulator
VVGVAKKYGVKDKDLAIDHIVSLVLSGTLRTGDRINRDAIATAVGVSRLPVQQAVDQLEHDGVLVSQYHRGVFVERFDEAAVREHHELYGVVIGLASARAATHPTPRVLAELDATLKSMRASTTPDAFNEACREFRRIIVDEYTGPALRALIRSAQRYVAHRIWGSYAAIRADFLSSYEAEAAAIRRRDPDAARAACINRTEPQIAVVLAELTARGVLADTEPD